MVLFINFAKKPKFRPGKRFERPTVVSTHEAKLLQNTAKRHNISYKQAAKMIIDRHPGAGSLNFNMLAGISSGKIKVLKKGNGALFIENK